MKYPGITAIILFLGALFVSLPTVASAVELVASDPATIYYTASGAEPTTTITMDSMTTMSESLASPASVNVFDGYTPSHRQRQHGTAPTPTA